jgi:hypothetical protein
MPQQRIHPGVSYVRRHRSQVLGGLALIGCLLCLASCSSGRYTPKPSRAEGVVQKVSCPNAVAVVNGQSDGAEYKLEFGRYAVQYQEFTQAVVDALQAELERHGVTVQDGGTKTLRVTVTKVTMMPSGVTYRATIEAIVETGDGKGARFQPSRGSYASGFNLMFTPMKPMDASFRDLVGAILENDVIKEYLAK